MSGRVPSTIAPSNVIERSYVPELDMGITPKHNLVEPIYVPGLHDSHWRGVDTDIGYTENRVLTPSTYRTIAAEPLSPRREYGTQTGEY